MGRRMRKSESVGDVEGLLNQALMILDASGLQLTAIHVDMARNSLMKELGKIDTPTMGFSADTPENINVGLLRGE